MWQRLVVYIACFSAMFFWSLSFIWYKDIYPHLTPFVTIFSRLVISSVLIFITAFVFRSLQRIEKNDYKNILLLAFFEPFMYFMGESLGMQRVSPTTGSVIISIVPLLVPVAAYFYLKERLMIKNVIGIVISCSGVVLVVLDRNFEFSASLSGVMLMGLSVIAATFYSVILKQMADKYNLLTLIGWQNTMGAVMFVPLVFIFEPNGLSPEKFTPQAMIPLFKLAVFASSLAFMLYTFSVKKLGAVRANIFTNLIPVITAQLSMYYLHEKLLFHNLVGIGLVIGGLLLAQIKPLKYRNRLLQMSNNR